ncbi:hypothetical protein B0H11DRAFT_2033745 [Mycena galericulata]|nr:hypothetical protein B0H11DRAFT_2033745 [Mycena galericulata]
MVGARRKGSAQRLPRISICSVHIHWLLRPYPCPCPGSPWVAMGGRCHRCDKMRWDGMDARLSRVSADLDLDFGFRLDGGSLGDADAGGGLAGAGAHGAARFSRAVSICSLRLQSVDYSMAGSYVDAGAHCHEHEHAHEHEHGHGHSAFAFCIPHSHSAFRLRTQQHVLRADAPSSRPLVLVLPSYFVLRTSCSPGASRRCDARPSDPSERCESR